MRVIAGSLKGRQFDSPHTHRTHPMSDKVRGALFNILGDIDGLTVLDPFAGTGAVGFEAISRGAASALLIEQDKAAHHTITENIRTLDVAQQVQLVRASASAWLQTSPPEQTFDLVICDPPYQDLQLPLIVQLAERVVPDGLLVLSWPTKEVPPVLESLTQIENRAHGDAQLIFYRR
jgi:16S rRNA (guanine966-N2)-methyltransferase